MNKAIVAFPRGVQSNPHFAADNRLVQRLQSSGCPCRVPLHGPVQFAIIRGIRLVGHMFPQYCPFLFGDRHPHVTHCSPDQVHSSSQTESRSVQSFLHGSQIEMICCRMNCQWGRNKPKIALSPWDFVTLPEEDWAMHGHRQHAEQEIRSVEHGICPLDEFTSPYWIVRIITEYRILFSVDVVMYMYCFKMLSEYW